ncbi:MAG: hypothetical protein K2Y37_25585 [Pirellulales bacterium]|nr:hypothetical protein [Pirellulales bacterium]
MSVITAGLLAFHAAVGCCAHHAHDCQGDARHSQHAQLGHGLASHCHHDHGDQHGCPTDSNDQDAPDDHGCDGVRCVFLSSGGSQQVQALVATAWIFAPLVQPDQCLLPTQFTRDSVAQFSPAATRSVRLHLLHELFLI